MDVCNKEPLPTLSFESYGFMLYFLRKRLDRSRLATKHLRSPMPGRDPH